MNEAEWMKKQGQLLTKKQYFKLLIFVIGFIAISLISVIAGGGVIAMLAQNESVFIVGFVIGVIGFILFLISLIVAFKNWPKIMLYRHYQKYPEDFDNDISK
ncbi:MAG: hypothetical protein HPY94_05255 [Clostridia bacterium]|nr:hypothetical protein [Clostridia bacterium]